MHTRCQDSPYGYPPAKCCISALRPTHLELRLYPSTVAHAHAEVGVLGGFKEEGSEWLGEFQLYCPGKLSPSAGACSGLVHEVGQP